MGRILASITLLGGLALAAACDDPTGFDLTPILVGDTVLLAAPIAGNEDLPTALDITGNGAGGVVGGRFPERAADAMLWDFLVRIENGQVVLVPARVVGVESSRAAISPPLAGETFEELREAPGQSTFVSTSSTPLVEGEVYAARSRDMFSSFGSVCAQFAKLKPLDVDPVSGRVEIAILTNERCGDPRLAPV